MTIDKDTRIVELTHQRNMLAEEIGKAAVAAGLIDGTQPLTGAQVIRLVRDMAAELLRQRRLAALWKRLHWAAGWVAPEVVEECAAKLRAMGESPEHDAGDPGGPEDSAQVRMAYAPQAGDGAEVV